MQKYYIEARILLALAIPVVIGQVSQTAMGFVDTVMAGGYNALDMSAVAIGTSIWLPAILFAHGLLLAMTPIIAQYNGAAARNKIPHIVHQGFWLASIMSVIVILALYHSDYVIFAMHNIDPLLGKKAVSYLHALMWGAPGYLFFQVYRNQCDGLSKTKPGMMISIIGLLVNIPINYVLIYGKFGLPALGGVGCGVATAIVYWIMFFIIRAYTLQTQSFKDISVIKTSRTIDWNTLRRLTNLGLPIALAMFFEVTLFAIVALLVSPLGIIAVAGHQIALNFSTLLFVLPMSFAIAATIRIGYCLGENSADDAKISAYTMLWMGFLISVVTAFLTLMFRKQIALLYNDDPTVVFMASHLLLFAAIYQCSDSIQVISAGILRGYKDTRSIFIITLIAYWGLGLPSGYYLALTNKITPPMGPAGFWIGFIIGLTAAAIMLISRMFWLQKQPTQYILYKSAQ